jgi:hypothetical protein
MFPGKNKLTLSHETLGNLVLTHLQQMDKAIRIEEVSISYTGCDIRFTTDKEKVTPEAPKTEPEVNPSNTVVTPELI